MKKVWTGLALGLVAVTLVFMAAGCGTTSKEIQAAIDSVTTVGTSKHTVSGSVSYASGVLDLNLNAILDASGEAITGLTGTKFKINVDKDATTVLTSGEATVTLGTGTKPLDIVFVLDNTGSMGGAITGAIDSINAFAASLEAGGADVRFGLVTYGDSALHPTPSQESYPDTATWNDGNYHPRPIMDFGTASALKTLLSAEVYAEGGSDGPENPLDAAMYGYNSLTWRTGAQKVFIIITDINAHQNLTADSSSDNKCTTTGAAVLTALAGKAVVYAVSPNYTTSQSPYFDVRRLADGLGEGRVTAESSTGGKWLQFNSSTFDLNTLGIATTLTAGYTLKVNYSFEAGTWYVYVQIDTDGDGVYDSNMLLKLTLASSSSTAFSVFGDHSVKAMSLKKLKADDGIARPNK